MELNNTADYSLITLLQPHHFSRGFNPHFMLTNKAQTGILKMFEHLWNDLVIYGEAHVKRKGKARRETEFF